jgi:hypothetical protein
MSRMNRRMPAFYSFAAGAVQVIRRIGSMLMTVLFNYKYEMTRCTLRDVENGEVGASQAHGAIDDFERKGSNAINDD